MKQLPIKVTWSQDPPSSRFSLKYLINKKYKGISYLAFNLGDSQDPKSQDFSISDEELKKLKSQQQFLKVDREQKSLKLWIANMKQHQGTIDLDC